MNWNQLRTILWLRWRLTRNQMRRGGKVNAVITMIFLAAGVVVSLAGLAGGIAAGWLSLAQAPPWLHLLSWDIIVATFLFFWAMSLLVELQRSETIDLSRLMHLPVSLRQIFFLNYLSSHVSPLLILTVPGMLGLALGMVLGGSPRMLLLFPLVLGFVYMITAWTYCLRGWLVSLMVNKRRRRAIVVGLTMAIILIGQLPNLYFNVFRSSRSSHASRTHKIEVGNPDSPEHQRSRSPEQKLLTPAVIAAHQWVPLLWLPKGAMALAQRQIGPAILGAVGTLLIGSLGLMRAYRSTLGFYQGRQRLRLTGARRDPKPARVPSRSLLEKTLPWLSPQTGVMTLAFLRSMLRAPEVKMALIMPAVMLVIFGSMLLRKSGPASSLAQVFAPTGLTCLLLLGLAQLSANHFGLDRTGFRTLVLLPVTKRRILLAKNLALLGAGLAMELVALTVVAVLLRPPAEAVLSGLLQFLAGYLLLSLVGNVISILTPYRIAPGSLKPTKTGSKVTLVMLLLHLLLPVAMLPILVPAAIQAAQRAFGFLPAIPLGLLSSVLLLGLVLVVYVVILSQQGQLMQQREKQILEIVTKEVE